MAKPQPTGLPSRAWCPKAGQLRGGLGGGSGSGSEVRLSDDSLWRSGLERRISRRADWLSPGTGLVPSWGAVGAEGLDGMLFSDGVGEPWKSHNALLSGRPSVGWRLPTAAPALVHTCNLLSSIGQRSGYLGPPYMNGTEASVCPGLHPGVGGHPRSPVKSVGLGETSSSSHPQHTLPHFTCLSGPLSLASSLRPGWGRCWRQ